MITFSNGEANAGHDVTKSHKYWRVPRKLESEAIWIGVGQAYIIILESSVSTDLAFFLAGQGEVYLLPASKTINHQQTYKTAEYVDSAAYCCNESAHLLIVSNISLQERWQVET